MARKNLGDAFGGKITTLEEQRAIWLDALHEDAIWEGPTFEIPVTMIGFEAVSRFMEFLLSVVPRSAQRRPRCIPQPIRIPQLWNHRAVAIPRTAAAIRSAISPSSQLETVRRSACANTSIRSRTTKASARSAGSMPSARSRRCTTGPGPRRNSSTQSCCRH
jgi:hypothetical protein